MYLLGRHIRNTVMKKFIASAGLVALGASATQAASPFGGSGGEKPWDVSVTVRGFYDDNYYLASQSTNRQSSFGLEVRPSVGIHLTGEQTTFGAHYTYSMRYYDDRKQNTADHSHEFNTWLMHTFSERYSVDMVDTLTIAQEPTLLDTTGAIVVRSNGNNLRNDGAIRFHAQLTRLLEVVLGYRNVLVDYENKGGNFIAPSYTGLLDRLEHTANIDLRWQFRPETVGIFGYQYGFNDYTGKESIGLFGFTPIFSNSRNSRSHYVYAGVEHNFLRNLTGSARAGAQFISYYNTPTGDSAVSPYADLNLRYTYRVGSFVELGFQHQRNATDAFSTSATSITTDQESSSIYANITHAFTPKLIGNLNTRYQMATFTGGGFNNQTDDILLLGVSLEYHFNRHLSAEIGYNYDKVTSNVPGRDYDRNRVFLGMTASY